MMKIKDQPRWGKILLEFILLESTNVFSEFTIQWAYWIIWKKTEQQQYILIIKVEISATLRTIS